MAKLRKASAYRLVERPYTRKSKYRAKSFVRANPQNLVVKFEMGDTTRSFPCKVMLQSKEPAQIRHNALESARKSANKLLETTLGKKAYRFRIKAFPHHVLRENPLASGAGADRMSTGMKMSFGKSIGLAAQVKKGQTILEVEVDKKDLATAQLACERANHKFARGTRIVIEGD
ncbi:50S ribosomal protein L16 [Candidatus Woesearchaeota archaeon]|nr:50S ribosomal protein L16 [Candidatus Woesearchaeota archaeon]